MKISSKIIKFLDSKKIKYEIVNHKTVYTAYDKAATLKVKPNVIGKTLVLKVDKDLIMVLVPGNKNLDLLKIKKAVNEQTRLREAEARFGEAKARLRSGKASARQGKIGFVSETIIKNKFKGVKLGAIPPFGEIYKLPVFVDRGLAKEKNIFVNSGIYEASFKVSPKIFHEVKISRDPSKKGIIIFQKLGAVFGNFSKAKK